MMSEYDKFKTALMVTVIAIVLFGVFAVGITLQINDPTYTTFCVEGTAYVRFSGSDTQPHYKPDGTIHSCEADHDGR